MNPHAAYWNQGIAQVPHMTGAASLLDGADIRAHAEALGFTLPFASVLDVGCGTGRLAAFARTYVGVDIASDAVAYCHRAQLEAWTISGPHALPAYAPEGCQWVTCLSVFTHIDRTERLNYLHGFTLVAPNLLIDIIPGDGSGDVAMWTADVPGFEADLGDAGWRVVAQHERACPSGPTHRFYRCARAVRSRSRTDKNS